MTIPPNYLPALIEDPVAAAMMRAPSQDELRVLGLDDASLDAQWDAMIAELRAEGRDVGAMMRRAGASLTAWHELPAVIDGTPRVIGRDVGATPLRPDHEHPLRALQSAARGALR